MVNVLIAVLRLFARLPLSWVRVAGHGLGWLLWHLARKRRRIVLVNLKQCLPELSAPEREALAYRHFVAFGQSVMDRSWLWHAPEALVRQRLRWVGDVQALQQPGPLVMFAPHFVGLDAGGMAVSFDVPGPVAFIFVGQSRPAVEAGEKIGFLPGDMREKVDPYLRPIYDALYDFMEGRLVAEAVEIELQRLALDQLGARHVVDHEMGKVGLAGDRAQRGELGRGKADHVQAAGARIGDIVQYGRFGRGWQGAGLAQMQGLFRRVAHALAMPPSFAMHK